ncbi:hypothetical protein BLJ79_13255 [Arthrobacter sp. UCD-GKA]|uniref:CDP-glycerol glycerophosphotransferase family protein n=1 Tax=Arthrobacter sp. UCD-GKA TaxID=1913576 RepID=UPI0008DDCBE0|nr:CDP-glycerol glycerophosphotransferase family protein [Arthrobacter sp. UCD-GKA]OIH83676.1 hypothetical protein BLJ79_13255 [Arthrobacter sp. UCD-GKA]
MKTLKHALRATLLGLLYTLPLAGLQSFVFWTVHQSIPQTFLAFCLWFVALAPIPGLRVLSSFPGIPVAHGLGLPKVPDVRELSRYLTIGIGVLGLLGAVVLFWKDSWLLHLIAALTAMLLTLVLGVRILIGLRSIPFRKSELKATIAKLAPDAIIYTGRSDGGDYQIRQWLSIIQAVLPNTLIVTRDSSAADALAAALPANTPIVTCRENADLDMAMHSGAQIVFYVNSVGSNSTMVNYRSLHHVYLGHGDSDKEISAHPVHRMYDSIFVSGRAAIDRYATANVQLDHGQAVLVGRPQLAELIPAHGSGSIKTMLYAPTWSGYNLASSLSSLDRAEPFIQDCLDRGLRIIFRPHPFSLNRGSDARHVALIDALLQKSSSKNVGSRQASTQSLYELFNQSDALATDISSIVVDYLPTHKPIAILTENDDVAEYRRLFPTSASAYLASSPASPGWQQMFGSDAMSAKREELAEYYVSDATAKSFDLAIEAILARLASKSCQQESRALPDGRSRA